MYDTNEVYGFRAGWLDAVYDLRERDPGFRRDAQLNAFAVAPITGNGTNFMAFYLAGYDTLTRGYIPDTTVRSGERFDLHRLGGLPPRKVD